jgi:hypothetical protein
MPVVSDAPTASIPTFYDETFRSKQYVNPSIISVANNPTLLGFLESHAPTTDGSFSICIAGGQGVFVSKVRSHSIILFNFQLPYLSFLAGTAGLYPRSRSSSPRQTHIGSTHSVHRQRRQHEVRRHNFYARHFHRHDD